MDEDGEFEVTAEMLIHEDVDDEQTLAEEEALQSEGEAKDEMADLQQESELPLEELLKRYGYSFDSMPSADAAATDCGEEEEGRVCGERESKKRERDGKGGEEGRAVVGGIKRVHIRGGEILKGGTEGEDLGLSDVKRVKFLNQEVLDRDDEVLGAKSGESVSHTIKLTNADILNRNEKAENSLDHLELVPSIYSSQTVSSATAEDKSINSSNREHSKSNAVTSPLQSTQPHPHSPTAHHADNSLVVSPSTHHTRTLHEEPSTRTESCVVESSAGGNELFLAGTDGLVLGQPLLPEEIGGQVFDSRFGCIVEEVGGEEEEEEEDSDDVGSEGEEGERREKVKEQDSRLKNAEGYSSGVHVHTPSTSSISLQASSSTSSASSRDIKSRLRPEVPERRSMRLMANDEKVLEYFSAFFDDEEGDEEYVPVEEWKQEIRVGSSYQVAVDDRPSLQAYPPNATNAPDRLLWRPHTPDERVVSYLKTVATVLKRNSGNSSWETEQALQLLQECGHDVQRAIDVVQEKGLTAGARPWTEKECDEFEEGLRVSGKDFFQLKKQVPSRSVKELVEFYYFWKKSKRYDNFIQHGKIGKKKIPFQPGQVSDFMDNYLNMQDAEATDVHYATTTVHAEHKKDSV